MSTVCATRATLTSARLVTSESLSVSYRTISSIDRPVVYSIRVPYTTCSRYRYRTGTSTRTATTCFAYYRTRLSTSAGRTYTTRVPYTYTYHNVGTVYTTYYGTSCSTVYPAPTPGTTTRGPTQNSVFPTVGDPVSVTTTVTATSTPLPNNVPVGAIVGSVVGGLILALTAGYLIYRFLFRSPIRVKGLEEDDQQSHMQTQGGLQAEFGQDGPRMTQFSSLSTSPGPSASPNTTNTSATFQQYHNMPTVQYSSQWMAEHGRQFKGYAEPA